jgi:hypothetical protein
MSRVCRGNVSGNALFVGKGQPVPMGGVVPGRLQEQVCFGGFVVQDRVLIMDHGNVRAAGLLERVPPVHPVDEDHHRGGHIPARRKSVRGQACFIVVIGEGSVKFWV